ncbi:MAG: RidA family protein [Jannaschia sp.]
MSDPKTALVPAAAAAPFGSYSHGILAPSGGRIVVTSGQLGLGRDGACPDDVVGQAGICFATIDGILSDAGTDRAAILRLNAYVTRREDFAGYMAVRDAWLEGVAVKPASTLLIVSGFTRLEFLVEIEATAWVRD